MGYIATIFFIPGILIFEGVAPVCTCHGGGYTVKQFSILVLTPHGAGLAAVRNSSVLWPVLLLAVVSLSAPGVSLSDPLSRVERVQGMERDAHERTVCPHDLPCFRRPC